MLLGLDASIWKLLLVVLLFPVITVARVMSYIVLTATALMRLSTAAALSAMPPQPQMPMMPMRSRSTFDCRPRKSTAALKSSVLMSGDATLRG